MSMIEGRAAGAAAFFLAVLLSGIWLSRLGRPLSLVLSTLHKLLGLGTGVYLVVSLVQLGRDASLGTGVIVAAAVTGLAMLAGAATGGVLSAARPPAVLMQRLHATASLVALSGAAALIGMLL